MNLIVISKMSIYDELAYKCRQQKMQIEMREAIEAVRTINRSYDIITNYSTIRHSEWWDN